MYSDDYEYYEYEVQNSDYETEISQSEKTSFSTLYDLFVLDSQIANDKMTSLISKYELSSDEFEEEVALNRILTELNQYVKLVNNYIIKSNKYNFALTIVSYESFLIQSFEHEIESPNYNKLSVAAFVSSLKDIKKLLKEDIAEIEFELN